MASMHEIIDDLLEKHNINGAKMCADLDMSRSFMTELRKGRAKSVKIETAQKIASYFGVSVGYLLGEEETPIQPKQDRGLDFSNATPLQQMIIESVLNMPVEKQKALAQILGLEV